MIILNKRNLMFIAIFIITISIIFFFAEWLKKIDPTILTLISGGLGFAISKIIEDLKESKQRIYEQKRIYYNELIKPFRDILKNTKLKTNNTQLNNKQIADAMDSAFDNILYASDEVLIKYGRFRNNSTNEEETGNKNMYLTLKLFSELLLSMRKDLGNKYTNLDEVHLLRMFINMSEADEENYRKEFKKTK
jgi:hypothetical protein